MTVARKVVTCAALSVRFLQPAKLAFAQTKAFDPPVMCVHIPHGGRKESSNGAPSKARQN